MQYVKWTDAPLELACKRVWHDTPSSISFELELPHSGCNTPRFQFQPGQYVTLGIEIDGQWTERAYSISNAPGADFLRFTVKRVPNGTVSNWLNENLVSGSRIKVQAPTGDFSPAFYPAPDQVLLLGAGCGITPLLSMLNARLKQDNGPRITLIQAHPSLGERLYVDELEQLAAHYPQRFSLHWVLDDADAPYQQGPLDQSLLTQLAPQAASSTVFMCGPEGFMGAMEAALSTLGVANDAIHYERFQICRVDKETVVPVSIETAPGQPNATGTSAQSLLEILEGAGIKVNAGCRSGACGACRCKVVSGEVIRDATGPLSEEDLANGMALACSSHARGTIKLEFESN